MSNAKITVLASNSTSKQTAQNFKKVESGKNIEQELLFLTSYSHILFEDTEHAFALFSIYKILSFPSRSRKSYLL